MNNLEIGTKVVFLGAKGEKGDLPADIEKYIGEKGIIKDITDNIYFVELEGCVEELQFLESEIEPEIEYLENRREELEKEVDELTVFAEEWESDGKNKEGLCFAEVITVNIDRNTWEKKIFAELEIGTGKHRFGYIKVDVGDFSVFSVHFLWHGSSLKGKEIGKGNLDNYNYLVKLGETLFFYKNSRSEFYSSVKKYIEKAGVKEYIESELRRVQIQQEYYEIEEKIKELKSEELHKKYFKEGTTLSFFIGSNGRGGESKGGTFFTRAVIKKINKKTVDLELKGKVGRDSVTKRFSVEEVLRMIRRNLDIKTYSISKRNGEKIYFKYSMVIFEDRVNGLSKIHKEEYETLNR